MKMKLGHRNLFYSIVLTGILFLFLICYFVCMLPSLYVEYTMEQNLKSIKKQHNSYIENGRYSNVQVKNPTACFSMKIPENGSSVFITGKLFSAEIKIRDDRLKEVFHEIQKTINDYGKNMKEDGLPKELSEEKRKEWERAFRAAFKDTVSLPFDIRLLENPAYKNTFSGQYQNIHLVSDHCLIIEAGVNDQNSQYTNYIALEQTKEGLVLSFLPVVTPDMNEIRPVVLQSLPMLGLVILLLVLLFSQIYSKGIVTPVIHLMHHTEQMKRSRNYQTLPMSDKWKKRGDEIGTLTVLIDELFLQIRESYKKLEEKNSALEEENKRQEVLLRASAHQLKTPVSAALLLTDGMKNKIGKYRDTDTYLPKLKEQLLSMQKMTEEILYLNHCGKTLEFEDINLMDFLKTRLSFYQIAIHEKQLNIYIEGLDTLKINTDEAVFSQTLNNLLSNAVSYTPDKETVRIILEKETLLIQNYGTQIPSDILPHIFEPFVSGSHDKKEGSINSHGLGLYIAAYYAKKLKITIDIYNEENSVVTVLHFFTE